jgi:hypothetical protein
MECFSDTRMLHVAIHWDFKAEPTVRSQMRSFKIHVAKVLMKLIFFCGLRETESFIM